MKDSKKLVQHNLIYTEGLMRINGKVNLGLFALVALSFLLPFVKISCGEQEMIKLTGRELALGTTIERQGMFGYQEKQKVDLEQNALNALIVAVIGIIFSFLLLNRKDKTINIISVVFGFIGGLFLYLLSSKLDEEAAQKSFKINYEVGFYFALFCNIAIFILNLLPFVNIKFNFENKE